MKTVLGREGLEASGRRARVLAELVAEADLHLVLRQLAAGGEG